MDRKGVVLTPMRDLPQRMIQGIEIIPDWASTALRVKERSLQEALRIKDPLAVADARRALARIQRKLGLEGRDDVGKRV